MGVVWRAVQLSTKREVALKVIGAGAVGSRRAQLRFEREVELTARLDHPHVARVYDSGVHQGVYFYAAELIEGMPLDQYAADAKLTARQVLELMRPVCAAVQHAHQRGVIHRDLKPSNILVTPAGHPYVLDFGLAKATEAADGGGMLTLTLDDAIAGTPAFMSPEQAAGRADLLDTRTDVYSLGATLFLLLTGEPPHDVRPSRAEVLRRVAQDEPRRPRKVRADVDPELEAVVLKAIAREPERRYGTAGELAADIDRYLAGEPLSARRLTLSYVVGRKIRKHGRRHLVLALVLAILALLVGSGFSIWRTVVGAEFAKVYDRQKDLAKNLRDAGIWPRFAAGHILTSGAADSPSPRLLDQARLALPKIGTPTFPADVAESLAQGRHPTHASASSWFDAAQAPPVLRYVERAFAPNGRLSIVNAKDGPPRLLNLITGRPTAELDGPGWRDARVSFSPDSAVVVVASPEGQLALWDVGSRAVLASVVDAGLVAGAPEASASAGHPAAWELAAAAAAGRLPVLAVSADNRTVVYGSDALGLRAWTRGAPAPVRLPVDFRGLGRNRVSVSADGKRVLCAGPPGADTYRIIDVAPPHARRESRPTGVDVEALAVSADERYIAVAGRGRDASKLPNQVRLVEARTGEVVRTIAELYEPVTGIALSADGRRMVVATGLQTQVWDSATGELLRSAERCRADGLPLVLSVDASYVVADGGRSRTILPLHDSGEGAFPAGGGGAAVIAAGFAWGGRVAVFACADGTVTLRDVETATELRSFKLATHGTPVATTLSADGRLAAWCDATGLAIWDVRSGRRARLLRPAGDAPRGVAFSPDGGQVLSVQEVTGRDRTQYRLRTWDVRTGALTGDSDELDLPPAQAVATPPPPPTFGEDGLISVRGAHFRRDVAGRIIPATDPATPSGVELCARGPLSLVGYGDGSVELRSPSRKLLLGKHSGGIAAGAISGDLAVAASAAIDGSLKLYYLHPVWEREITSAGFPRELCDVRPHYAQPTSVVLSPSGNAVGIGYADGRALVWDASRAARYRSEHPQARVYGRGWSGQRPADDPRFLPGLIGWYALRREWAWAKEALAAATAAGADVPDALRARVLWATADVAGARAAFARAAARATGDERAYFEFMAQ